MKYIKLYEDYMDIDPYGEEDWDEVEESDFIKFLKWYYPDPDKWKEIGDLYCPNNNLTSLKGIENLPNLIWLKCYSNELTSLEGIEKLTNLKELDCRINKLTSLKGIENLINLKLLNCSYNQLTSLRGIEKLTNIKKIYCMNNNFSGEYKNYLKDLFKNKYILL